MLTTCCLNLSSGGCNLIFAAATRGRSSPPVTYFSKHVYYWHNQSRETLHAFCLSKRQCEDCPLKKVLVWFWDTSTPSWTALIRLTAVWDFYGLPQLRQGLRFTVKMAEAGDTPQVRFFCHCCKCETNPKLPVSCFGECFCSTRAGLSITHDFSSPEGVELILTDSSNRFNWLISNYYLQNL